MTDQPSTTATCAAGCGQPIDLTQDHIAIVRNVEVEAYGDIHVKDATVLSRRHAQCEKERDPDAVSIAWHDVTCPEGSGCRSQRLHALSEPLATSGIVHAFLDRIAALEAE